MTKKGEQTTESAEVTTEEELQMELHSLFPSPGRRTLAAPSGTLGAARSGRHRRLERHRGGVFQQLARVRAADITLRISTEHARDLGDPLVSLEDGDVRRGDTAARALAHLDVMMAARRDLRQVRNGEHL